MLPEPITHPRTRSLRLGSGEAGQVREDGAPGRALCGATEDGGPFKLNASSPQGASFVTARRQEHARCTRCVRRPSDAPFLEHRFRIAARLP